MVRTLRKAAIAAALLLAVGNAWALGLGQIEVKSRRNQPLLAEIPIISTTPGELEALQARLASPETFRRVGLAPPTGIAADLQFSLGSDARGRPVIRVTTAKPVDQAALNFLIEVDWGQGRLVREYSALVDAPNTASAPVQPAIEASVVAAPNVVQRPLEPAPVAAAPAPATPVPVTQPTEAAPQPNAVAPPQPVVESAPVPAPIVSTPAPSPVAATPAQYGPVKPGETLSKIAGGLTPGGYSLDQTMLALLRANPDAFLGDNINKLKRGAVLRVPESGEVGGVNADEATLVVREQMQQWRQARRPVAQPQAEVAEGGTVTRKPAEAAETSATAAPATPKPTATAPRRQQQARLEIVPPSAPGKATGTRSGTNAGGEGSMLQQQLRQKDEDIAAKAAEISELKERVAELEKLKQDQAQLLSMKDTELAAAQQNLADARKSAATPAATAAQTAQPTEKPQASNTMPWLWGGLAFIGMALLAWWFMRRKPAAQPSPSPRRSFDSEALAASMVPKQASETPRVDDAGKTEKPQAAPAAPAARAEPARNEAPNWHSGWSKSEPKPAPAAPVETPKPRFVPAEPDVRPVPVVSAPAAPPASPEQKMKLARAFLDIGDEHSAKELLRELLDGPDPAVRTEAARMLRELG